MRGSFEPFGGIAQGYRATDPARGRVLAATLRLSARSPLHGQARLANWGSVQAHRIEYVHLRESAGAVPIRRLQLRLRVRSPAAKPLSGSRRLQGMGSGEMQPPQPPQGQQQPQPFPTQFPQPGYAPPPRPAGRRLRNVVVVLVVVILALVGIGYYALIIYPQPNITLTDVLYNSSGCGFFGNLYYTYSMTFTLVNTGSADGFATVVGYIDGSGVGQVQYFVPHGTSVDKGFSIDASDCNTHTPDVAITAVVKA